MSDGTSELTRIMACASLMQAHCIACSTHCVHSHTEACLGGPDAEAVSDHIQEAGRPQASAGSEAHHAWARKTAARADRCLCLCGRQTSAKLADWPSSST